MFSIRRVDGFKADGFGKVAWVLYYRSEEPRVRGEPWQDRFSRYGESVL